MRLTPIAADCRNGNSCPTGYTTDRGTVVIQGYAVVASDLPADVTIPIGESVVEVPVALIQEMAHALRG